MRRTSESASHPLGLFVIDSLVSELSLDELAVEASDIAEIGYAITSVFNAQ